MIVFHWFRRDLRLSDNTALNAALRSGVRVMPLFVFDPVLLNSPFAGTPRLTFMLNALRSLDASLREMGSGLVIRQGEPSEVLARVVREFGAEAVYANRDYSPYARERDATVRAALPVRLHMTDDAVLRAPGDVLKSNGAPYTVFTPFMRRWRELPPSPRPETQPIPSGVFLQGEPSKYGAIPSLDDLGRAPTIAIPAASEMVAQQRLNAFVNGPIFAYDDLRNALVSDPFAAEKPTATSTLSPYLRCGMLSPRQAYWAAQDALESAVDAAARKSVNTWINELIWREFYMHILIHFPHVMRGNFRPEYDALRWRDAPGELAAWQDGRTGFPIVDAAMRQLRAIGWMPNRARMIVASFLTKDLLINWREGERHFMQWLIDGDPAANNGGWQWAAGTGTDAQPYFRIFNPVSQSQRFDFDGDYIRHWVPELRDLPAPAIHAPWQMQPPPVGYPAPLVDHSTARERTLAAFKEAKG